MYSPKAVFRTHVVDLRIVSVSFSTHETCRMVDRYLVMLLASNRILEGLAAGDASHRHGGLVHERDVLYVFSVKATTTCTMYLPD